jgi:hypothetical protein
LLLHVADMGTLFQELHPNLLIHLFAKNDLYLSIGKHGTTFNIQPDNVLQFFALFCHRTSNG